MCRTYTCGTYCTHYEGSNKRCNANEIFYILSNLNHILSLSKRISLHLSSSITCVLQYFIFYLLKNILFLFLFLGGIRCVKINAYLEQVLGFTNVSRLAGGVISYTRELEMMKEKEEKEKEQGRKEGSDSSGSESGYGQKSEGMDGGEDGGFTMISKQKNNDITTPEILSESSKEENIYLTRNVVGSKFKVPVTFTFFVEISPLLTVFYECFY